MMQIDRKQAMLCLDCDKISLIATSCPVCTSEQVVPISRWIPSLEKAREVLGKPENVVEVIRTEAQDMMDRINLMAADIESGEEPLGCGA